MVFTAPQHVLDAVLTGTDLRPTATVYIGGVTVNALSWDAQYDVDGLATSKITLPLPRPACVQPNATVTIEGGHNGYVGTLFSGRIPSWRNSVNDRGMTCEVRPVGWSSLLGYRSRWELSYDGDTTIKALFDSLCARAGVPAYIADDVTDPTGEITLTLNLNPQVDDGKFVIPANQTPLAALRSLCRPYGYRVYDKWGVVRLSRVSGGPAGEPVATFVQGKHPFSMESSYDISGIVNYPDINGPTYEDQYGASVPIRAFPATVEARPDLIPVNGGVNYADTRNANLTTQQAAEVALAVAQIDNNAPDTPVRWDAAATPGVGVGDCVAFESPAVEASGKYWLMSMDIRSDRGLVATYDGWAGAGEALPSGNNRTETTIQTAALHLGDEYLSHYAHPATQGTSKTWPITIAERATAVNVRGLAHGVNSQLIGGVNTDIEVTKWQVWLATVTDYSEKGEDAPRPEASGNMPIMDEDLALRRDYTNLANWQPFAINLGRLDPGSYTLRLVAGVKSGVDDFEVRDVVLETFGVAEPVVVPQEIE